MAQRVSTLVVTLTHGCHGCFSRIRKSICKIQETEDIREISFDEASRTVTISGTFDPLVLPCKLRRKAGRGLIRDIQLLAAEPTPQAPAVLPNPSGLAPSFCCARCGCVVSLCYCAITNCRCGGYGASYGCVCQASAFVNHPSASYYRDELPLQQQYPRNTCHCAEEESCKIM